MNTRPGKPGDSIFDETLWWLQAHYQPRWGDRRPIDIFNRLLAKNVKPPGCTTNTHMDITPERVTSRREQWDVAELAKLSRGHDGLAGPKTRFDGPIVVVEYQGEMRLLDGNHRINTWIARGDTNLHPVHIHTVEDVGRMVDLPGS